jgi:hypothetical protein
MAKAGGFTVVLVATGTAACGLMMIAGVGPTPADAALGDAVPAVSDLATPDDPPYASTSSTTLASTTTTLAPTTTTAASTTTVAPTTSSTSSTTTTLAVSPVPLSVSPATLTVGPGSTARISGTCPSSGGTVLGPVEIWQVGSDITVIHTGVTAAVWSYDWTAPTTIEPLVLQPWCGPPGGYSGGFPAELQIEVVFVEQQGPPPTDTSPAPPPGVTDSGGGAIPETD